MYPGRFSIAGVKLPETAGGKTALGKTREYKLVEVDDEKLENRLLEYLGKRASYVSELGRESSEESDKDLWKINGRLIKL